MTADPRPTQRDKTTDAGIRTARLQVSARARVARGDSGANSSSSNLSETALVSIPCARYNARGSQKCTCVNEKRNSMCEMLRANVKKKGNSTGRAKNRSDLILAATIFDDCNCFGMALFVLILTMRHESVSGRSLHMHAPTGCGQLKWHPRSWRAVPLRQRFGRGRKSADINVSC